MIHVIRFFRLVRLTESRNRIFFGYFGSSKLGTEQGTEFFGFGSFGFGSGSFGSVPRFRFFVPRLSRQEANWRYSKQQGIFMIYL
jgi:hypothetical protein